MSDLPIWGQARVRAALVALGGRAHISAIKSYCESKTGKHDTGETSAMLNKLRKWKEVEKNYENVWWIKKP